MSNTDEPPEPMCIEVKILGVKLGHATPQPQPRDPEIGWTTDDDAREGEPW